MNKKEERYQEDFREMFGKNYKDHQPLAMVKNLKEIQKNAYPTTSYKKSLKSKLDNIYTIGLSESNVPRWSIFQIFTVLGSFIFISGILLIFLDMKTLDKNINPGNIEIQMIKELPGNEIDFLPQQNVKIMDNSKIIENSQDTYIPESFQADEVPYGGENQKQILLPDASLEVSPDAMPSMMIQSQIMEETLSGQDNSFEEFRNICEENGGEVNQIGNNCIFGNRTCSYESVIGTASEGCEYIIK